MIDWLYSKITVVIVVLILIGFFVGQIMKQSKGKANPQQVNQMLQDKLK